MTFKKLDEKNEEFVFGMLRKAAQWLKDRNIDYWQNWFDPPEEHYNWIMKGLRAGQFHGVFIKSEPVGMFRLQFEDEHFWGKKHEKAVYIHSFTVKRHLAGQGTGYRILSRIENDFREQGFHYMRLDCGSHLEKLIEYYIGFGFRIVNKVEVDGYSVVLLEKKLTAAEQ